MKKEYFKFLLSPWTIIISMLFGVIIGIYFKELTRYLAPIGEIYISILKMSVLPVMIFRVV